MKVDVPFGRAPEEKVLEQDRGSNQQPVGPEKRQAKEGKEQGPNQVPVLERLQKRFCDQLRWVKAWQECRPEAAYLAVEAPVIDLSRVECW